MDATVLEVYLYVRASRGDRYMIFADIIDELEPGYLPKRYVIHHDPHI
jgi:hypothetical protein